MSAFARLQSLVPTLTRQLHKGQAGRIAVLGGSKEYHGAPSFAATAALRCGADLAHVFCHPDSAGAIKGFSPDLIVHSVLVCHDDLPHADADADAADAARRGVVDAVLKWLPAVNVLIIGPGLGRDPLVLSCLRDILGHARRLDLPCVVDGDGLQLVNAAPEVVRGNARVVLTPNVVEFARLYEHVLGEKDRPPQRDDVDEDALGDEIRVSIDSGADDADSALVRLAASLRVGAVVEKGPEDHVATADGATGIVHASTRDCLRRCGGQGDVLAGVTGIFALWAARSNMDLLAASLAASFVTRQAASFAFAEHGRAMSTSDIIAHLPAAMRALEDRQA